MCPNDTTEIMSSGGRYLPTLKNVCPFRSLRLPLMRKMPDPRQHPISPHNIRRRLRIGIPDTAPADPRISIQNIIDGCPHRQLVL